MHHLQDMEWFENYTSSTYSGPAVKVQAGIMGYQISEEAEKRGLVVVVGECPVCCIYDCELGFDVGAASFRQWDLQEAIFKVGTDNISFNKSTSIMYIFKAEDIHS